jgi:hypothetical protein
MAMYLTRELTGATLAEIGHELAACNIRPCCTPFARSKRCAGLVSKEIEDIPVKLFGAGLDLNVDVRAGISAIFRGVITVLNLEFLDGVERRIQVHIESVAKVKSITSTT